MELLVANVIYVGYRLVVTAHIIKFLMRFMPYSIAVLIGAQVSFLYDSGLFSVFFGAEQFPPIMEWVYANAVYTARVGLAWGFIKWLWMKTDRFFVCIHWC
jgi:hypothetical protein